MTNTPKNYRFGGIERLYGKAGFALIARARVCIVGIGGVGTWAAEALARSGIGHLTLVDADEICITNVNRQIHAMDGTVGQSKVQAMAERIRAIHPDIVLGLEETFFTENTSERILESGFDYVFDAIDSVPHKCHLIATCRQKGIPIITSGGAGGRTQPGDIQITDLSKSFNDPLLTFVRKRLRQKYGFPRERRWRFKVDCVFTPEEPKYPQDDGTVCERREKGTDYRLNCDNSFGTSAAITGTIGFLASAHILNKIAGKRSAPEGSNSKETLANSS